MLSTIAGRRVWVSRFVGTTQIIVDRFPIPRRGFSVRKKRTVYTPTGVVYLLGNDACVMHPDDFEKLKGGE